MITTQCPKRLKSKSGDRLRKDLQHHLWMTHRVDVIESHQLAKQALLQKDERAKLQS